MSYHGLKGTTLISVVSGPIRSDGSVCSSGTTFAVSDYDRARIAVDIAISIARKRNIDAWIHSQSGRVGGSGVIVVGCEPRFVFTVEGFISKELKPVPQESRQADETTLIPCRDNHAEQERFADFG